MTGERSEPAKPETVRETLERVVSETRADTTEKPEARERAERLQTPEVAKRVVAEQTPESGKRAAIAETPEPMERSQLVPPAPDRPRDQFGRFTRTSDGAAVEAPQEQPTAPSEPIPDQTPDTAPSEPSATAIAAPVSWSAAARTEWDKLPRVIQDEVLKREGDVSRGFEQRAAQIRDLEPIVAAIAPYAQKFSLRGQHPALAVQQLLAVQDLLERDPIEGLAHVARSYGVDLSRFAAASEAVSRSSPQDPQVRQLSDQMAQLQAYIRNQAQTAQSAEMNRIQHEVQAFESDRQAHPHFAEVRPAMAQLMQSGLCSTLQEAYDHACWAIPEIRSRILASRQQSELANRQKAERDAADRARRAGVSVGSSSAGNGAIGPSRTGRTLREDIEAAIEQASR